MHERLGLRLRFALFFAALAVGGVVALAVGLWLGAARAGGPVDGYVIAGLVAAFGIVGLSAWVGLLFDENVARPILGREAKVQALKELSPETSNAIAVGDGANDLGMIELAGMGVALHAKPVVAAAAPLRIDHNSLTALLFLQGYARSDFAI